MARGGKRELVPRAWIDPPPIDTELVENAIGRQPTPEEMAELEAVRRDLGRAINSFENTPLASRVDKQREQLAKALKILDDVFRSCDREPGLRSALAGLMREGSRYSRHDAERDLMKLRALAVVIQDQLHVGAQAPRTRTANVEPKSFCYRVLLERLIPLARNWGLSETEASPRFVSLVHAFGLDADRNKTRTAVKNHRPKISVSAPPR